MGWVERLDAEKNEEMYLMIEVRPEGHKDRLDSDITLNRLDMRSKFGYTMLVSIAQAPLAIGHNDIYIKR